MRLYHTVCNLWYSAFVDLGYIQGCVVTAKRRARDTAGTIQRVTVANAAEAERTWWSNTVSTSHDPAASAAAR